MPPPPVASSRRRLAPCVVRRAPKKKGKGWSGIVDGVICSRRVMVGVKKGFGVAVAVGGGAQGMVFCSRLHAFRVIVLIDSLEARGTHEVQAEHKGSSLAKRKTLWWWREQFMETTHRPLSVVDAVTSAQQDPLWMLILGKPPRKPFVHEASSLQRSSPLGPLVLHLLF